jgi:hypothetical protein
MPIPRIITLPPGPITPPIGAATGNVNMIGTIIAFAGKPETIPEGWLLCNGAPLPRNGPTKPLFDVIGNWWGDGDGVNTFSLPDLRGQFLRGVDGTGLVDEDLATRQPHASLPKDQPGSIQDDSTALPTAGFSASGGPHGHSVNVKYQEYKGGDGPFTIGFILSGASTPTAPSPDGSHQHVVAGGDIETHPKNAYVYYIIKYR